VAFAIFTKDNHQKTEGKFGTLFIGESLKNTLNRPFVG
jgi:hypothetical protein